MKAKTPLKQNQIAIVVAGLLLLYGIIYGLNFLPQTDRLGTQLSNQDLISTGGDLISVYSTYKDEIKSLLKAREDYCTRDLKKANLTPHIAACLTGQAEYELLYLRLRLLKPRHILELASAWGGTTLAILAALHRNGYGTLYSVEMLVDRPWYEPDLVDVFKKHLHIDFLANTNVKWTYYFEDATKILPTILKPPYDYIHIDADHSGSFAVWYTSSILAKKASERPLAVSAHDVIECTCDPDMQVGFRTSEGAVFERWLTYGKEHRVVSASMYDKCDDPALYTRLQQTRRKFLGENVSQNYLGENDEDNKETWEKCETSDTGDYISTSYAYLVPN